MKGGNLPKTPNRFILHSAASAPASAAASVADLAAFGVAVAAVVTVAAGAAAAVSNVADVAVAMIAVPAAFSAAFWLIIVCLRSCLCFRPPPQLPAPAIATVVCRRH